MAANLSFTQYEQAAVRIRKAFRHSAGLLFLTARQLLLRCVIPALLGRGRWIVVVVEGLLTVRFSVRVDLFLPFGQRKKATGHAKDTGEKRGEAALLCKDEQNISLVLLFLLAAQSQTKMYHFHGVPFLRISALFFAEKKGDVPTLYSPDRKA